VPARPAFSERPFSGWRRARTFGLAEHECLVEGLRRQPVNFVPGAVRAGSFAFKALQALAAFQAVHGQPL
jgi:hypothetical protein